MKDHYPVVVVGAGPAGLAAACELAPHTGVAVLDEQPAPGGQIYRAMERVPAARARRLGKEYRHGGGLLRAFRASGADYFPSTAVWSLNGRRELGVLHEGAPQVVSADQLIIASGARERPLPFPGWTLPGVMNAGAGQILFKAHGIVPQAPVVLAGSGPLLLLLARQYLRAGVSIRALLDLTPRNNHWRALPRLPRALLAGHYLRRGLAWTRALRRAGVAILAGVSELRAEGEARVQRVSFSHGGREHQLETALLLVHFGIMPNTELTRLCGCEHAWDDGQQCWRPRLDEWGRSSQAGVLVAGDGAGIDGARSAEYSGRLAALEALHALGLQQRRERDRRAAGPRRALRHERHIRPFLERYFRLPEELLRVSDDDTLVCRCEEVSAGEVRAAVAAGYRDSNQVKFLTRCGMGPCQGRQCELALGHVVAAASGRTVAEAGHYRCRPPVQPLTLGELAQLYPEAGE